MQNVIKLENIKSSLATPEDLEDIGKALYRYNTLQKHNLDNALATHPVFLYATNQQTQPVYFVLLPQPPHKSTYLFVTHAYRFHDLHFQIP